MRACRILIGRVFALLCLACGIVQAQVVTEFTTGVTSGSHPWGVTAGPDGNLWFAEAQGDRIGRITPSGAVTEFTAGITAGSHPKGITPGPDGNLWFTESNGLRIGQITTAGVVTEFSTGISGSTTDITTGSDGNLWFTEAAGRIGRITTAGVVTEFSCRASAPARSLAASRPAPTATCGSRRLTAIGSVRLPPAGVVTEFSIGHHRRRRAFSSIAAGPDGNLWFTEFNGSRIGRITPTRRRHRVQQRHHGGSGPCTESPPVPTATCGSRKTSAIAIGRITPAGVVTEFSAGISAGAALVGITAGPDGNLWFTEFFGDRIGRITTPPPALLSAVSRKVHGAAGTFDLPLSLVATNPTTEPRQSSTATIVLSFDTPIISADAAITEGTATAGAPTFSGNDVIVPLTGVADQQYVTISLTNVSSALVTGGSASTRLGFLRGDVNGNRVVTLSDLAQVNAQLAQTVTATNFLKDVNASGTLSVADKAITNANLTRALPAP